MFFSSLMGLKAQGEADPLAAFKADVLDFIYARDLDGANNAGLVVGNKILTGGNQGTGPDWTAPNSGRAPTLRDDGFGPYLEFRTANISELNCGSLTHGQFAWGTGVFHFYGVARYPTTGQNNPLVSNSNTGAINGFNAQWHATNRLQFFISNGAGAAVNTFYNVGAVASTWYRQTVRGDGANCYMDSDPNVQTLSTAALGALNNAPATYPLAMGVQRSVVGAFADVDVVLYILSPREITAEEFALIDAMLTADYGGVI